MTSPSQSATGLVILCVMINDSDAHSKTAFTLEMNIFTFVTLLIIFDMQSLFTVLLSYNVYAKTE